MRYAVSSAVLRSRSVSPSLKLISIVRELNIQDFLSGWASSIGVTVIYPTFGLLQEREMRRHLGVHQTNSLLSSDGVIGRQ